MKYCLIFFIILSTFACNKNTKHLPYYDSPDFTPKWLVADLKTFHQIRPFTLINQENQNFTEKDMDGKISVVDFFFATCPGICPKLAKSMADIQKEFIDDDDILLVSHTVTPDIDNVSVLKKYAKEKKVNFKRWKLLTGKKEEIYNLGREFYFIEEDEGFKKNDEIFLHTENFVLLDKQRHIRGIYNGLDPDSMQKLIKEIKILKKE